MDPRHTSEETFDKQYIYLDAIFDPSDLLCSDIGSRFRNVAIGTPLNLDFFFSSAFGFGSMQWNAQLHMDPWIHILMNPWIHGSPDPDGGTHYESTGFQDACKMGSDGWDHGREWAIRQAGEQIRDTSILGLYTPR